MDTVPSLRQSGNEKPTVISGRETTKKNDPKLTL